MCAMDAEGHVLHAALYCAGRGGRTLFDKDAKLEVMRCVLICVLEDREGGLYLSKVTRRHRGMIASPRSNIMRDFQPNPRPSQYLATSLIPIDAMMLTTNFASLLSYPQYLPQRPSPLSPRSANARLVLPLDKMSGSQPKCRGLAQEDGRNSTNRFALYRRNPLMKSSEERTKLRRSAYLERVKAGQEDQRWGGKSDQARHRVCLQQRVLRLTLS